jgi:voltage-gated potassium channel
VQNFLVKIAFFLYRSKGYNQTKKFFYDYLENNEKATKHYIDLFFIFLILFSVFDLVHSVKNETPYWIVFVDYYIITTIFIIEYILRLWVHGSTHHIIIREHEKSKFLQTNFSSKDTIKNILLEKWQYIKSPIALIDLIAIIPIYREIRIIRIFKLTRYIRSVKQFFDVLKSKYFELMTLAILLLFVIGVAGVSMYTLEGNINSKINSLLDAFYWALITATTVGYGDISPVSNMGKIISMITAVVGLIIIAFGTSLMVSAFFEKLGEIKDNRIIDEIKKIDNFVIICGYGQMTKMLLREDDFDGKYIIIEKNPDVAKQGAKDGYNIIMDDASKHNVLEKFKNSYSKISLICLVNNDIENIYITLNAKSISKDIMVVARASNASMEKKFKFAGADNVIVPNIAANTMLLTAINNPIMYSAMHSLLSGKNAAYLDEIKVLGYDNIVGKKIADIDFKEYKLLLIGLKRNDDFIFNPNREMVLESDDILLVMGLKISIEYFHRVIQGSLL